MTVTGSCFSAKRYGVIGNGVSLGVENLLVADRQLKLAPGVLVCRVRRVGGVPCLGLDLTLDEDCDTFVLPSKIPEKCIDLGYLNHQGQAWSVCYDESPWPAYAPNIADEHMLWVPISEILNQKAVYGVKIHQDLIILLENNREGCFLFDDEGDVLPSPSVVYNGAYVAEIAASVGLGKSRASPFRSLGPNFYFGSFALAMIYAVSFRGADSREVGGKCVTRPGTEGIYKKGGIARYIIMEGALENGGEEGWLPCIDTVYQNKGSYDKAAFVIKDFGRQSIIDYAIVSTNRVRKRSEVGLARVLFRAGK